MGAVGLMVKEWGSNLMSVYVYCISYMYIVYAYKIDYTKRFLLYLPVIIISCHERMISIVVDKWTFFIICRKNQDTKKLNSGFRELQSTAGNH